MAQVFEQVLVPLILIFVLSVFTTSDLRTYTCRKLDYCMRTTHHSDRLYNELWITISSFAGSYLFPIMSHRSTKTRLKFFHSPCAVDGFTSSVFLRYSILNCLALGKLLRSFCKGEECEPSWGRKGGQWWDKERGAGGNDVNNHGGFSSASHWFRVRAICQLLLWFGIDVLRLDWGRVVGSLWAYAARGVYSNFEQFDCSRVRQFDSLKL